MRDRLRHDCWALAAMIVLGFALVSCAREAATGPRPAASGGEAGTIDAGRAFGYLKEICKLGPRPSGSAAMARQQLLLIEHFERLGAKVYKQEFRVRHPINGSPVPMANLLVQWHPERRERILLAAHYDTRPFPDRDPARPRGTFIGANDGASGVALLMELAHHVTAIGGKYGIDFVLFDGEEFVFSDEHEYLLGSTAFARAYASHPPEYRYRMAIVLDMIGDRDLELYFEKNSLKWPETRALAEDLWNTARKMGVREFIAQPRYEIRDDHLPLVEIGRIPAIDVIDFDYPFWHTEGDTPERCSAESLQKVGRVLLEWLRSQSK